MHERPGEAADRPGRVVIEGRSSGGGAATVVVGPPSSDDRYAGRYPVLLYCPGPSLLTRAHAGRLITALQALLER